MASIRITFILLSAANFAFGAVLWDENRVNLKKSVVKNHRPIQDYRYSREVVMQKIHLEKDNQGYFVEDVYCHQTFRNVGPNRMPEHTNVNIEHTWPQSRFSRAESKRNQKSDLHHLYPTQSQTNNKRASFYFSEVEEGRSATYDCEDSMLGSNPENGKTAFEPPDDHKGNVARALFYFSIRYDIEIPDYEEIFLLMWNEMDPVDENELKRNDIIEQEQGNRNPFIDDPGLADTVTNF